MLLPSLSIASVKPPSSFHVRHIALIPSLHRYFSNMFSNTIVFPSRLSLTAILGLQTISGPNCSFALVPVLIYPSPTISRLIASPNALFKRSSSIYGYISLIRKIIRINYYTILSLLIIQPSPPPRIFFYSRFCTVTYLKFLLV